MTPALTPSQLVTLKNAILADPALNSQPNTSDGAFAIAAAMNLNAVPDFFVWRTNVPTSDCKKAMVWTEFIGRSQGERDAWMFMLSNGIINAADSNVRQGILDIFSGPSGATTRANLTAIANRVSTRAEKLFATGTGSSGSPATMTAEGALTFAEVQAARAS